MRRKRFGADGFFVFVDRKNMKAAISKFVELALFGRRASGMDSHGDRGNQIEFVVRG